MPQQSLIITISVYAILIVLFIWDMRPRPKQITETYLELHYQIHMANDMNELHLVENPIKEFLQHAEYRVSPKRYGLYYNQLHNHFESKWWSLSINEDHVVIPDNNYTESTHGGN